MIDDEETPSERYLNTYMSLHLDQLMHAAKIGKQYIVRPPNNIYSDDGIPNYHEIWTVHRDYDGLGGDITLHVQRKKNSIITVRPSEFLEGIKLTHPFDVQDVTRKYNLPQEVLQLFQKTKKRTKKKRSTRKHTRKRIRN